MIIFLLEIFALTVTFLIFVLQGPVKLRLLSLSLFLITVVIGENEVMIIPFVLITFGILMVIFLYCLYMIMHQVHALSVKMVLDELPEAVCFSLLDGTPIFVNKAMQDLTLKLTGHNFLTLSSIEEVFQDHQMLSIHDRTYDLEQKLLESYPIIETIIYDRTQERALNEAIQEQTKALQKANISLHAFHHRIDDYVRSNEILAAQVHIHEDLGDCLLASQGYLSYHVVSSDQLKEQWHHTMHLMRTEEKSYTLWTQLLSAASFAHVDLIKQGVIPKAYEQACIDLVHLCLNAAIVAHMTKLYVIIDEKQLQITCDEAYFYQDEKTQIQEIAQAIYAIVHIKEGTHFCLNVKWRNDHEKI